MDKENEKDLAPEDILDVDNAEEELKEELDEALTDEQKMQARIDDLQEQLKTQTEAVEKEKKEYLFLMADFDNFRKRSLREKADLMKNAAEKTLNGLLPIVDDFERGLQATRETEEAGAVREGMELIYQKFVKFLADNGVKEMDTAAGADFDADMHEAIAMVPSPDPAQKGKIIDTTQKGYTLNGDKVLRHAKVVVGE